jgi:HlyD family secretion protein
MAKKIILIVVVLLIIGAGVYYFFFMPEETVQSTYQTAAAKIGDITLSVENSGIVKYADSTTITSSMNGTVAQIYVKNGDQVTANQPILRFDDRALKLQLEQAKTSLQIAKLNLANLLQTRVENIDKVTVADLATVTAPVSGTVSFKAEPGSTVNTSNSVMTITSMIDGVSGTVAVYSKIAGPITNINVASGDEVTAGQTLFEVDSNSLYNQVEIQKQNVYNSQLKVDSLNLDYEALTLRAPRSGTISDLMVEPKQSLSPNSKIATLTSKDLVASIEVDELDISYVKLDMPATLYIPGYSEEDLVGTVSYIANKGNVKDGITSYEVQLSFANNAQVKEGMSVDVAIILDQAKGVLRVPSSAVMTAQDGKIVRVLTANGMERKSVVVGISDDTMTEIVSGLNVDDMVVTAVVVPSNGTTTPGTGLGTPGVMIPGVTGGSGGGGGMGGGLGGGGGLGSH